MIGPHKAKTGSQGITEQLTGHRYGGTDHELPGHRNVAESISAERHEDEDESPEVESDYLEHCAQEIIDAVRNGDALGLAEALRNAFEELDEEPHEEGPHLED